MASLSWLLGSVDSDVVERALDTAPHTELCGKIVPATVDSDVVERALDIWHRNDPHQNQGRR